MHKNNFYIIKIILVLIFIISEAICLAQSKTISITDFGYVPGSRRNVVPFVQEALKQCAGDESVTLIFPKGRYDFWQDLSSTGNVANRLSPGINAGRSSTPGIAMQDLKNVVIDGDNSEFIYHGNMQIASVSRCENIVLKNFSADWDFPFMYQGTYLDATDEYIELEFDKEQYRYVIEDERFFLTGEGWKAAPKGYFDLFDRDTKEILYNTMDFPNIKLFTAKAEEIRPGVVRFYGKPEIKPPKGTYTNLMAGTYMTNGISVNNSKDVLIKDVTVYHALSHAFYGSRSENIIMDNASVKINEKKGRVVSNMADCSHFASCKGYIKILNCAHTGGMDDFINVHGSYASIDSIIGDNAVMNSGRRGGTVLPGEEIWFVNPSNYQRSKVYVVQSVERLDRGSKITFTSPIHKEVKKGHYMENKTWTPTLEIRNCSILKQHRARGILVTTPQKVVIEDNYFRAARTAILIAGDMDYWFESGGNLDVTIRNNVFENCLTSTDSIYWDEAIITIEPSHKPQNDTDEPYHRNIRIENNIFKTFDSPLVYAKSVRGLIFRNNEIIRTYAFEPFLSHKPSFRLNGCRDVVITGNKIHNEYMTRIIEAQFMKKSDIKSDGFILNFKK